MIETFSILAGSMACNARCPFCVSKMTPKNGMKLKAPEINIKAFEDACIQAKESGVRTAMITSKGEPTLFPEHISQYMGVLKKFDFPTIELQTNGIEIYEKMGVFDNYLKQWHDDGLRTVAISIVHHEPEMNRRIYLPYKKSYIDLPSLVGFLHGYAFSVRFACVMLNGFIDSPNSVKELMRYARENGVEQLTIRPVNSPEESMDADVSQYVHENKLSGEQIAGIKECLETEGRVEKTFPYGGAVYSINGQNICLTNSLTHDRNKSSMRQLIFFPDGRLSSDWVYEKDGGLYEKI